MRKPPVLARSVPICMCAILIVVALVLIPIGVAQATGGDLVWARSMGGSNWDTGFDLAIDGTGNTYTTGFFKGTADFDPGPGAFNLTSTGDANNQLEIFVSKLDNDGNFVWARAMGGTNDDIGLGVAVDGASNVYTIGRFQGTADFDPGPNIFNLTSAGTFDVFVSKLDGDGNFVWARAIGSTNGDGGLDIVVDEANNVYITGHFQGTVDFDPGLGNFNLTSAGFDDIYVTKLAPPNIENDSPGVIITETSGSTNITEGGTTDTYEVVLTSEPTATVTMNVNNDSQSVVGPTMLTFNNGDWNITQTVTITAVDDDLVEGPHSSTISHIVNSADGNYDGIAVASVTANITDNDSISAPPGGDYIFLPIVLKD